MPSLYGRTAKSLTLTEAIQGCGSVLNNSVALLYSHRFCRFGKLKECDNIYDSRGKIIPLEYDSDEHDASYIFEARIFNEQYELRWLNEDNGLGKAVLTSEESIDNYLSEDLRELIASDIINQQYLLWGEKTTNQLSAGWQRLAIARIGALDIPVEQSLTKQQRVYLNTREYLAAIDEYGNMAVVAERLINLEVK